MGFQTDKKFNEKELRYGTTLCPAFNVFAECVQLNTPHKLTAGLRAKPASVATIQMFLSGETHLTRVWCRSGVVAGTFAYQKKVADFAMIASHAPTFFKILGLHNLCDCRQCAQVKPTHILGSD
jgi:hypothetical protein